MPISKTKSQKRNKLQEWWGKLRSPMKVTIISGSIAGCFGLCIAIIGITGNVYVTFLNNDLSNSSVTPTNNPLVTPTAYTSFIQPTTPPSIQPANIFLYRLATNHIPDYYKSIGCTYSMLAIAADNPESNQIAEGNPFIPENIKGLAIVAPIYTYLNFEADLPNAEFATVENIRVSIDKFESRENKAIIIVPTSTCAGSDPGYPNLSGIFPIRITPKNKKFSITEARETKPSDLIYTITKDAPLRYKLFINSLDSGWYTVSVQANYHYNGQKGVANLDEPIILYVPDENYISGMFYSDWLDNNKIKALDNKTQVDILKEGQELRENWVIMTLETPVQNPNVSSEYLRIENLGLEQDMTGWTIEGRAIRNMGGDVRSTPTFTFPDFILPEWGVVRIWSGKGKNKNIDLYWNLDQTVWSNITELTNIVLLNKSSEIVNTVFINPNTLKP